MDEHSLSTTFKKRSCFFQLPYWETLLVRHNLDPMHIEKNLEKKKPISRRTSKNNKTSQPKVPRNKVAKGDTIKCGMKVGLTSPNSAALVALATVQNIDKEAKCMDGKPLSDYVEERSHKRYNFVAKSPREGLKYGECSSSFYSLAQGKCNNFKWYTSVVQGAC